MEKLFQLYLHFYQKSYERKSLKKYFLHIFVRCLTCDTNPGFMCNKPTHYLLDYGDFMELYLFNSFGIY